MKENKEMNEPKKIYEYYSCVVELDGYGVGPMSANTEEVIVSTIARYKYKQLSEIQKHTVELTEE